MLEVQLAILRSLRLRVYIDVKSRKGGISQRNKRSCASKRDLGVKLCLPAIEGRPAMQSRDSQGANGNGTQTLPQIYGRY
jgi:hypothetical protein